MTAMAEADWGRLARRAKRQAVARYTAIYAFLLLVSIPLLIPYLWLVTTAFGAREPSVLWRTVGIVIPAGALALVCASLIAKPRRRTMAMVAVAGVAALALSVFVLPALDVSRFRALFAARNPAFPTIWQALANSLFLAATQTVLVLALGAPAAYYISRFRFKGRNALFQGLILLHAFPVMTLIIPLFLLLHWVGLLDRLFGVVLVLVGFELPFAIFILKGFFDGVPWETEMSAISDGASRRQAFVHIVLPQVKNGLIVIAVFSFMRGWEEYVFVLTFLIRNTNWVMSLFLFFANNAPAVALIYLVPNLLMFAFLQRYITQLSLGGIRG